MLIRRRRRRRNTCTLRSFDATKRARRRASRAAARRRASGRFGDIHKVMGRNMSPFIPIFIPKNNSRFNQQTSHKQLLPRRWHNHEFLYHFWVVAGVSGGGVLKGSWLKLRLVLVRVRAWCVLRFSGVFWVLAENGFSRENVPERTELEGFL